ncbi:MAG: hypothetical protein ACQUHE_16285 [Bacteroidia bacterium]
MQKMLLISIAFIVCFFIGKKTCLAQSKSLDRFILTWDFFKNDKPKDSPTDMLVYGGIGLKVRPATNNINTIKIIPTTSIVLNSSKSFVSNDKKYKDTSLIHHHQGLVDIVAIYATKLKDTLTTITFSPKSIESNLNKIHTIITNQMLAEQKRYSIETKNGLDNEQQKKWDLFIRKSLGF